MSGRRVLGAVLAVVGVLLVMAACHSNTSDGNEGQVRSTPPTVSLSPAAPVQPSPSSSISASTSTSQPATMSSAHSSVASPSPTEPSPASSPAPTTEQAAPVVVPVAPAPPTRVEIPAIGKDFQQPGEVASVHNDDGSWSVTPPEVGDELKNIYWWNEHSAPGNSADGTVFFYLHSCKNRDLGCAGDDIPNLKVGDLVQVTNQNGTMTFQVVEDPKSYPKEGENSLGKSKEVYNYNQPGVLRIITCGYTGEVSDINWVITTQLVS